MIDLDLLLAQWDTPPVNLEAEITFPPTAWEFACLLGQTLSTLIHGFPDVFDGIDHEDFAESVYRDEVASMTYRQMIEEWQKWERGE